jgi:hypothetical protein
MELCLAQRSLCSGAVVPVDGCELNLPTLHFGAQAFRILLRVLANDAGSKPRYGRAHYLPAHALIQSDQASIG